MVGRWLCQEAEPCPGIRRRVDRTFLFFCLAGCSLCLIFVPEQIAHPVYESRHGCSLFSPPLRAAHNAAILWRARGRLCTECVAEPTRRTLWADGGGVVSGGAPVALRLRMIGAWVPGNENRKWSRVTWPLPVLWVDPVEA